MSWLIVLLLAPCGASTSLAAGDQAQCDGVLVAKARLDKARAAEGAARICAIERAADARVHRLRLDFVMQARRLERADHDRALVRLAKAPALPPPSWYARPAVVWPIALAAGVAGGWLIAR